MVKIFAEAFDSVDLPAQRRSIEKQGENYHRACPQPYFGVLADVDLATDQIKKIFRIGTYLITDRERGEEPLVMNWTSDEGRKFSQSERDLGEHLRSER